MNPPSETAGPLPPAEGQRRFINDVDRYGTLMAACESLIGGVADDGQVAVGDHGLGYCNITKCCTEVCPEHIHITDNALIPLKERVADRRYDPLFSIASLFRKEKTGARGRQPAPATPGSSVTRSDHSK